MAKIKSITDVPEHSNQLHIGQTRPVETADDYDRSNEVTETVSQRALNTITAPTAVVAGPVAPPLGFTSKQITRRVLKQGGDWLHVQIEAEIFTSDAMAKSTMEPARVVDVIDLSTREPMLLIVNRVLESELVRHYPNNGYIGRYFSLRGMKSTDTDKRYRTYEIHELFPEK